LKRQKEEVEVIVPESWEESLEEFKEMNK